jgi:hypothetical protein
MQEDDDIEKEVIEYKNSSNFKINFVIKVYKIFRFMNGDTYAFVVTLSTLLITLGFIRFDPILLIFGLVTHYFLIWKLLKPRIDRLLKSEEEASRITKIIEILESYKKENPNV